MPNVWAHFIFGQQVLERLGEMIFCQDEHCKNMFNLGCQGPDFLFYHRFLPWQRSKALNQMGTEMHNRHCGPVIMTLLDAVQGRDAGSRKPDDAVVYALGFVLHHILDRHVHPYVFSKSGFRKWDHQRFEIMIDTLIAAELWKVDTTKTPAWKHIRTQGGFPSPVVDAFETAARAFYPGLATLIDRNQWNEAKRDFTAAQRLFHDPTGLRRKLTFGQIEPFVFKAVSDKMDILNVAEQPWLDPVTGDVYHHESVWTLWGRAMEDACAIIPAVLSWLRACSQQELPAADSLRQAVAELRSEVSRLIGNRSYETGLDCASGLSIQYADTIWDDQPGITRA
jgi:hypothetical protein